MFQHESAKHLGMLADKNMAKGNGNLRASVSSLLTNAGRAKDKSDPYTWKNYTSELAGGGASTLGAVGALSFTAGLVISSPVLAIAGTVASAAGAIQFAGKAVQKRLKRR